MSSYETHNGETIYPELGLIVQRGQLLTAPAATTDEVKNVTVTLDSPAFISLRDHLNRYLRQLELNVDRNTDLLLDLRHDLLDRKRDRRRWVALGGLTGAATGVAVCFLA